VAPKLVTVRVSLDGAMARWQLVALPPEITVAAVLLPDTP